ncbi:hypothetical protein FS800_23470 [Agrobacterium vitis]|uniref:hypothetical protein n=1 Tax=Allorhizobium ampelinum TaxID=3025782 RepID=UPI001F2E2842|nr:hypothetical protein [Allorhizobium ampelinum]MCF1485093.1 hypothetical protein [Allorhizobium ampelinum]
MADVVKAVMKMIVHIEATSVETVTTVEQAVQTFVAGTHAQYGSVGRTEWAGTSLKVYLDLPFPVVEPAATTTVVDDATSLITDLKKAEVVAAGQVETEYAAYDAAAFAD